MAESLGTRLGRKFTSAGADREVHLDRKLLHEGKFDKGTWPCLHSIPSTWNEDQYVFSFQAVNMDNCNPDGLTSSMADDIFFVLQKCTRYRSVVPSQMATRYRSVVPSQMATRYRSVVPSQMATRYRSVVPSQMATRYRSVVPSQMATRYRSVVPSQMAWG